MNDKLKKWIIPILIFLIPLLIAQVPVLIQYFHNHDVGIFYYYGITEANYGDEYDLANNRLNAVPFRDEVSLYAPRVKEVSEGKFPSDAHIKEYSDRFILLHDVVPLFLFGTVTRLTSINVAYFVNAFLISILTFVCLLIIFSEYLKDRWTIAAIISAITFHTLAISLVLKRITLNSHISDVLSLTLLRSTPAISKFYNQAFPIALFVLSLVVLKKLIYDEHSIWMRILLMLTLILNAYTYFYNWTYLAAIITMLLIFLVWKKDKEKAKSTALILFCFLISALPQVVHLLKQNSLPLIEKAYYDIWTFNIGDLINIAFLMTMVGLGLLIYTKLEARTKRKILHSPYTPIIATTTLAGIALSSADILLPFPQPGHYIHLWRFIFYPALLMLAASYLRKHHAMLAKASVIMAYILVILLTLSNAAFDMTVSQNYTSDEIREADAELFDYLNTNARDMTVVTLSQYMNTLIPIYTNSYVYIPEQLYTGAKPVETVDRVYSAGRILGVSQDAVDRKLETLSFRGFIFHLTPEEISRKIISESQSLNNTYDYDFILSTPYEKNLNSTKFAGRTPVFHNSIYALYAAD